MSRLAYDHRVAFKAPRPLIEAAREAAHAGGMTLSELLRASLRAAAQGRSVDGPLQISPSCQGAAL